MQPQPNDRTKWALAGSLTGFALILFAMGLGSYTENSGRTQDANIQAGIIGVVGIGVLVACLTYLGVRLARSLPSRTPKA